MYWADLVRNKRKGTSANPRHRDKTTPPPQRQHTKSSILLHFIEFFVHRPGLYQEVGHIYVAVASSEGDEIVDVLLASGVPGDGVDIRPGLEQFAHNIAVAPVDRYG